MIHISIDMRALLDVPLQLQARQAGKRKAELASDAIEMHSRLYNFFKNIQLVFAMQGHQLHARLHDKNILRDCRLSPMYV